MPEDVPLARFSGEDFSECSPDPGREVEGGDWVFLVSVSKYSLFSLTKVLESVRDIEAAPVISTTELLGEGVLLGSSLEECFCP